MTTNGYDLAHPADLDGETSYTFTCGKIDAGIAVLIGSHAHLIEFPSLLLPPGCEPGSIVSITCSRNHAAEESQAKSFWDLQTKIFNQFGSSSPAPPNLKLRSVTQTSVALEWDRLELAQTKLLSLSIWKNGQRLGQIPNALTNSSTKLSGLDLDTEYVFHLVMKTTGGTLSSKPIKVRTHSLNDTSGINVCFGVVLPEELLDESKDALEDMGGRWTDKIQIDTTHFVCTAPYHPQQTPGKPSQASAFPSLEYQRALQLSIPIVQPTWLLACLAEGKMIPIAAHYLGANPGTAYNGSNGSLPRTRTGSKAGLSQKTESPTVTDDVPKNPPLAPSASSTSQPSAPPPPPRRLSIATTPEIPSPPPPEPSPTHSDSPSPRTVVPSSSAQPPSSQTATKRAEDDPFSASSPSIYNPSPARTTTHLAFEEEPDDSATPTFVSPDRGLQRRRSTIKAVESKPTVLQSPFGSSPSPGLKETERQSPIIKAEDEKPEGFENPVASSDPLPDDREGQPTTMSAEEEKPGLGGGGGEITDLLMGGSMSQVLSDGMVSRREKEGEEDADQDLDGDGDLSGGGDGGAADEEWERERERKERERVMKKDAKDEGEIVNVEEPEMNPSSSSHA